MGDLPAGREHLGFVHAARSRFGFLRDRGYGEVRAEPTYLRFERGGTSIAVFHGRLSYELGVEFGRQIPLDGDELVEEKFHIRVVLSVLAPEVRFTPRAATSPEQVARFLDELAGWTKLAADRLERAGVEAFARLSEEVVRQSDEYSDGVQAGRLRAGADEAWRRKDFAEVVTAYEEVLAELRTVQLRESELERLHYARRRVGRT